MAQLFSCAVGVSLALGLLIMHSIACQSPCSSRLHSLQPFRFAFSSSLPSSLNCHSMHGIVCQSECSSTLHCLQFLCSIVAGLPTYQPAMPFCISHDMPAELLQLVFVCCRNCANDRSFAYYAAAGLHPLHYFWLDKQIPTLEAHRIFASTNLVCKQIRCAVGQE